MRTGGEWVSVRRRGRGFKMLLLGAGLTMIGGFLADWNRTHLFNPRWTPHSKYHSAQTIVLAAFLGGAGLYLLLKKRGNKKQQLWQGTLLPALFWTSMLLAFAFPNAKGLEADCPKVVPKIGPLWINEAPISFSMLLLLAVGFYLERRGGL